MDQANLITLTAENFADEHSKGTMIVDFWAPWCGPCRSQLKIIDAMIAGNQLPAGVRIGKVNIDEQPQLAATYSVTTIPTLIVFRNGKQGDRFTGVQSAEKLLSALE